ncbi:hypothetical protein D3C76_1330750 [compost metagenome]
MLQQHHAEQGHQENFHRSLHQAAKSQHVAQHDPGGDLRVVQMLHVPFHRKFWRDVLVSYHGLHQVFGSRFMWVG